MHQLLIRASPSHTDFHHIQKDKIFAINFSATQEIDKIQPQIILTHFGNDLNIDNQIIHKSVITACIQQPGHIVKNIIKRKSP